MQSLVISLIMLRLNDFVVMRFDVVANASQLVPQHRCFDVGSGVPLPRHGSGAKEKQIRGGVRTNGIEHYMYAI